ncbi:hypothetical protein DFH06DRAFT_1120451 [Mycena polygramma]|nr:hypothetical protein DFH06DRAFT_1120451 [Mycena polygramma]
MQNPMPNVVDDKEEKSQTPGVDDKLNSPTLASMDSKVQEKDVHNAANNEVDGDTSDDEIPELEVVAFASDFRRGISVGSMAVYSPLRRTYARYAPADLQRGELYAHLDWDFRYRRRLPEVEEDHRNDAARFQWTVPDFLIPKFHNACHTQTCIQWAPIHFEPSVVPPMDSPATSANDEATSTFDRIQIYSLQRDPEWMRMVRERFRMQEGPAPKACSWCQCKAGAGNDERIFGARSEWVQTHWKRVTLDSLGYVYQQGHDGLDCPNPAAETKMREFCLGRPVFLLLSILSTMPRRRDDDIHYEADIPEELFEAHRGIHVSNDGARVTSGLHGLRPQKRGRKIEDLGDDFAGWTPVDDSGLQDVQAVADTVTSYEVTGEDDDQSGKRKRYKSSDWAAIPPAPAVKSPTGKASDCFAALSAATSCSAGIVSFPDMP